MIDNDKQFQNQHFILVIDGILKLLISNDFTEMKK